MREFIQHNITHFCLIALFALLVCGVSYSEPLYDIVEVDLSRPVDIGPTVLQPGHYRFEQVNGKSDPSIFRVTGKQGEIATLNLRQYQLGVLGRAGLLVGVESHAGRGRA
jgi:hypothetical protein